MIALKWRTAMEAGRMLTVPASVGGAGGDESGAARRIRLSKCLICAWLSGGLLWDPAQDSSREERHSEVNCELAARCPAIVKEA